MILFAASAAFVGLVHSMAPGHWLPVVLMAKTRRWSVKVAVLGALITASGHIILSLLLAGGAIAVGAHFLSQYEGQIESYAGLGLVLFGAAYAIYAYVTHSRCHGHEHHGPVPDPKKKGLKGAFLFLFSTGLSPCVAVLPVIAAAAPTGLSAVAVTMLFFALGVSSALVGSTVLVTLGILKLDHPLFEHYGDVITGVAVALMGVVLFFLPRY